MGGLFRVRQQHPAVPVQQSQKVLGVDITVLRQPFQILCCLISLGQRQLPVFDPGTQSQALVGDFPVFHPLAPFFHLLVLEGDLAQADILCLPDDSVPDGPELFLLGQRRTLLFLPRVELVHLTLELPPLLIALVDNGDLLQLIHDLIHLPLHGPRKISVGLLAFDLAQLLGQLPDHLLRLGVLTDRLPHLPGQLQHNFPGLFHQLIS